MSTVQDIWNLKPASSYYFPQTLFNTTFSISNMQSYRNTQRKPSQMRNIGCIIHYHKCHWIKARADTWVQFTTQEINISIQYLKGPHKTEYALKEEWYLCFLWPIYLNKPVFSENMKTDTGEHFLLLPLPVSASAVILSLSLTVTTALLLYIDETESSGYVSIAILIFNKITDLCWKHED